MSGIPAVSREEAGGDGPPSSFIIIRLAVCTILGFAFVIGVPGNSFVIWTVCGRMKRRSPTVLLILHLAVADLLVLATLPVWIYAIANAWVFGMAACKALALAVYCSMYVSIFLITALSVERFLAVFYPFAAQRWRRRKAATHLGVFLVWVVSVAFGAAVIPFQDMMETEEGLQCAARSYGSNSQEVACLLLETLVGFVLPFAIISTCYACVGTRVVRMACPTRRRSARLVASVVVAFGLCWLPHHAFNLLSVASVLLEDSRPETSQALGSAAEAGVYVAGSVAFVSSCVNPLLYAFAARNVRSSVRFAKFSKLFEQISPAPRMEATKDTLDPCGKEETVSMEVI